MLNQFVGLHATMPKLQVSLLTSVNSLIRKTVVSEQMKYREPGKYINACNAVNEKTFDDIKLKCDYFQSKPPFNLTPNGINSKSPITRSAISF